MTDMSRRNFMKSAGVMALAVAAAGVLSGCDSSKNPVMAEVKVEYWRKEDPWLQNLHIGNGVYDETVQVVKGGKVKKTQLTQLGDACSKSGTTYSADEVPDEIEVKWDEIKSETEIPTVKVHLVMV